MHGISKATMCRNRETFVNVVVRQLLQELVNFPPNMHDIAGDFFEKGGMPCVVGCVDGTHIPLDAPYVHEEAYVNRYGEHSLNTMLVCGPDLSFYYAKSNFPGSSHDSRVLRNSSLYERFEAGWRPIPGAIIIGDTGYFLRDWLIPSVRNEQDIPAVNRMYRALKRTRRLVECAIGVLKESFPCLNHLRLQPRKAALTVLCCVTLHNLIIKYSENAEIDMNILGAENTDDIKGNDIEEEAEINVTGQQRLHDLIKFFQ